MNYINLLPHKWMACVKHRLILIASYVYATCFDPFLGHYQARQYKIHLEEDTMK